MSKRHQASRRRTYGRRQHELREREERTLAALDELDEMNGGRYTGADVAIRELGLRTYGTAYLGAD